MNEEPAVLGDWMKEKNLGSGGFGIVTLWRNIKTEEKIAIKKCRGDLGNTLTKKHKERWTKEVEMMKKIDNSNIVNYCKLPLDFETELQNYNFSHLPMLSMEYCSKGDLRTILGQAENCCGLLESDVRFILSDLMNAVSYLHELKITHRDLKPENIVLQLCDRPNQIIYKLIDLGYAKEIDAQSICASFVGTLQYLAPEFLYSKSYSCSVDYWSMGLVAYEISCGFRPFLPNMSPAQWLPHVEKKSNDIISIYQEADEKIVKSNEIFPENHISSSFKYEIEQWLCIALEFNPKKRGYSSCDSSRTDNELIFFSSLKSLLDKKILSIFSVYNYELYSYEIDDCTLISTLQGWIERDTKITKSEQLLISSKIEMFKGDDFAMKYFDETYKSPMVYIFKNNAMLPSELAPVPLNIKQMLENPKVKMQYYFQKRCCAHALYFIYEQTNLYNTVLEACNIRLNYMLKLLDAAQDIRKNMTIKKHKLIAQKEFSNEVLNFDYQQYLTNYIQNANHWTDSFDIIAQKIEKLNSLTNHIDERYESVNRRVFALNKSSKKDFSKYCQHELNELLESALMCYNRVRAKNNHSPPENCIDMVKILYKVFKARDRLIFDIHFRQHLKLIVHIDLELDKLMIPLNGIIQHLETCEQEILNDHLKRQKKIWEFTIKQKPKKSPLSSPDSTPLPETNKNQVQISENTSKSKTPDAISNISPKFILGNPKMSLQCQEEIGEPISLSKPLNFILGGQVHNPSNSSDSSSLHSNSTVSLNDNTFEENKTQPKRDGNNVSITVPHFLVGEPASNIIDENRNLRFELQEKNNESYLHIKNILKDSLDFSFLKE